MYGLFKVHKDIIDYFLPSQPLLSAINTPTYWLVKFIVPISKSWTSNKYTVKEWFAFAEEVIEKGSEFFMGSLDSLFTNIPLEETTDICPNTLFENTENVTGLSKI